MTVKEAKEIAKQWVVENASKERGFYGAFFVGSLNWYPEESTVPGTSDIDIKVLVEGPDPPFELNTFRYRELLLEVTRAGSEAFQSADTVLSDYTMACHFARPCIISDPTGQLTKTQQAVSKDYFKHDWVRRRCKNARSESENYLRLMKDAEQSHDKALLLIPVIASLAHMLLVADLKNPTIAKCLMASRKVLAAYGGLALHELMLTMLGSAYLDETRVEALNRSCADVFDVAKSYVKTPSFFTAKIADVARDNALGSINTQIEQGYHREAVLWLLNIHATCQFVLFNDAPAEIREQFAPGFERLLNALSLGSSADFHDRASRIEAFIPEVWEMCESISRANPAVLD